MNTNDSPRIIAKTLGNRLKQARLNANLSQEALAIAVGLSKNTIVNVEAGRTKLETLIAVMQGLGLLEQLDLFLPEQPISPLQIAKIRGAERKRASKKSSLDNNKQNQSNETEDDSTW